MTRSPSFVDSLQHRLLLGRGRLVAELRVVFRGDLPVLTFQNRDAEKVVSQRIVLEPAARFDGLGECLQRLPPATARAQTSHTQS